MTRFPLAFACFLLFAPLSPAAEGLWPFLPGEEPSGPVLLDLRVMNEAQSGETGFVRLSEDGNSFVRGDGQPIRFWACGSDIYRRSPEEMDEHCRHLARIGVNMARLHATVAGKEEGQAITDVNQKEIEGIFRFIKAAKDNGIYVTISPYYGHHGVPASWELEGFEVGQKPWGAIFVDPRMQQGYKAWTRALYTTVNPHTGLAIKDDPTVAILQVHNEDSLFFWTSQDLPEPQMRRLGEAFGDWLNEKYGSPDAAIAAWDGKTEKGDDLESGVVSILSAWHMTQDWKGGADRRMRDQTQFLAELQRDFYAGMGRYLREELGCKQLLNATNWRTANDEKLKAIERWTYAALDIDAENEYYGSDYQHIGQNNGYRIDPGHYMVNESCLHKPLELTCNFKQHDGHPFIVTETSWKHPNLYQSEGPFLISAYQSLGGVDAVFWFSANTTTWLEDPRRLFWRVDGSYALDKWSCSTPMLAGMFPAASIVFRTGALEEGAPIVREVRKLESIFRRETSRIDDNEIYGVSRETDECKVVKTDDGRISRAAFLVGPVQVEMPDSAEASPSRETEVAEADFSRCLDPERDLIRSVTGQLVWNYDLGICGMSAPRAQGVAGFLQEAGGRFPLADCLIESENDYASVWVVPLDDRPIAESREVLIQVGTTARLEGWEVAEETFDFKGQAIDGLRIVNSGAPPWQIADTKCTVTIANPNLGRATRLSIGGRAVDEVDVARDGDRLSVQLPKNTMYLLLRAE